MTTLYAWARPLGIDDKLDHTWVTDFQPATKYSNITAVIADKANLWFCWGDFHTNKMRSIGKDGANLALAQCLVTPNDPNAHGTIFRYAIDGVCHQLANQVLYSTTNKITVSNAHGYRLSHFLYGTYGTQKTAWAKKIASCTQIEAGPMDDFETYLRSMPDGSLTPDMIEALLPLRADFQAELQQLGQKVFDQNAAEGAASINELISTFMTQAHKILGNEGFQAVFDTEMRETFALVDPDMFAQSEVQLAKSLTAPSGQRDNDE